MEIFVALTKYNTPLSQQKFSPVYSVQRIDEDWNIPINVHL